MTLSDKIPPNNNSKLKVYSVHIELDVEVLKKKKGITLPWGPSIMDVNVHVLPPTHPVSSVEFTTFLATSTPSTTTKVATASSVVFAKIYSGNMAINYTMAKESISEYTDYITNWIAAHNQSLFFIVAAGIIIIPLWIAVLCCSRIACCKTANTSRKQYRLVMM